MASKVHISPENSQFGFVSYGYLYNLKITVTNHGSEMGRFRIAISNSTNDKNLLKCTYAPVVLAPGVSSAFIIELETKEAMSYEFNLNVSSDLSEHIIVKKYSVIILALPVFRSVAKFLHLHGKDIHTSGVKCIEARLSDYPVSPSVLTAETTLTDEDIEEILDIPLLENTYWDPYKRKICVDRQLSEVFLPLL